MKKQHGSTLLVVLVLLIIMLMAGMALFKATDIAALISANTANKQKGTQLANQAVVKVMNDFFAGTVSAYSGATTLTYVNGIPDPGNIANSWTGAENSNNCTTSGWTGISGNSGFCYRYIIEQLWCKNADGDVSSSTNCGPSSSGNIYSSAKGGSGATLITGAAVNTFYRLTINVNGPKNTNNYVQTIFSW